MGARGGIGLGRLVILAMLARSWKVDVQVPEHIPMQSAITLRPDVPMPALVFAR